MWNKELDHFTSLQAGKIRGTCNSLPQSPPFFMPPGVTAGGTRQPGAVRIYE